MDNQDNQHDIQQQQPAPYWLVFGALVTLITISTIFFHHVEGWSYFDSYYYTIVTIATVGYGDFVPTTTIGRFAATILIILGIGLFSAFVSLMLKRRATKDFRRRLPKSVKNTLKDGEKTIEKL
ncbi:two pore domain potassium channel family protein [Candidatus Saccharibacteria bacterium]|nr:two pore domain potassium channel family protein [Candidatus Saccharibacteria bacterium]MDQ5885228.1 voltage-gated potassium channel [Patescibacteria group bacterium]MDQ5953344.1 voltage-gated potassium channel [Patescibacteria group bacterium]MDQ5958281.1 voltage-gated potassium channel [Patescibacteria group bacterium]